MGAQGARKRPGHLVAFVVLLVLPLALRLIPIGHGMPRNYVPDTHVVRGALGMAKDRTLAPPIGTYSTYPNLVPYTLLPVYAVQYAAGRATGAFGGAEEFKLQVALNPERVHLPARVVVALFGALTAWVVFRGARAAGLGAGAWVAAWLVATALLHVQFSVQERPWTPLVFFVALAVWAAALFVREGRTRHLVLCGVAAGLASACHQAGLPALLVAGIAWLVAPWRRAGDARPRAGKRVLQGVLGVAAFAAVVLVVGMPHLFVHGMAEPENVAGGVEATGIAGQATGQAFHYVFSARSLARLSRALVGYEPVLVLLGLAGGVASFAPSVRHRALWPAFGFGVFWAAVFLTNFNDHVRYLLPLVLLLAYPAGVAGELLARARGGRVALVVLLAFPLVQSARLGHVLTRPDTRALCERRLAELPADARVAIARYGPLADPTLASLERLAAWRPLTVREDLRRMALEAGPEALAAYGLEPGVDVVRYEDLFASDDRDRSFELRPPAAALATHGDGAPGAPAAALERVLVDALGVTHVVLCDRGPERYYPLAEWVAERPGTTPLFTLDPTGAAPASLEPAEHELMLPMELDFALTGIWRAERPGPRLTLVALR